MDGEPLLMDPCSAFADRLRLDSVDRVNLEALFALSSLCLTIFVRRGLRGASVDEFGRSSDELAFD